MSTAAPAKGAQKLIPTSASARPMEALLTLFRSQPLLPMLLAGAAVIAVLVALLLWARQPEYRVLFSGLSEADGGQIIGELEKRNIPYRLSEGGNTIMVPSDKMNALRLQLAEQGLPKGGSVGFELLDKQAFGVSQFAEHLNYQRGLEGELSRTIESLGPVSKARVHLVMAKQSVFVRDREAARASVVLTLQPGRELGQSQSNAIVHLVSSSVPELSVDAVTIVDQNGRLLTQTNGGNNGLDGSQLTYVREVERSYQRRIEDILTPLLGNQNVHAQVVAQIDFSARESTAERYAPNQDTNEAAVRSKQVSEQAQQGDEAGGVPGALTNSPPNTPAPTRANAPTPAANANANAAATAAPAQARPKTLQSERMINYEVDRNVEHVKQSQGNIQRLTSAVVVNYRTVLKDGVATPEPLSKEELENINNLVRQAMGFSESRGDALQVINSPFVVSDTVAAEQPWWKTPEAYNLLMSALRYLLVAFAALSLWLLVLRPMQRRNAAQNRMVMQEESGEPGTSLVATAMGSMGTAVMVSGQDGAPHALPRKSALYEQNLLSLQQIAVEDPRLVAMIVRGWMKKND
ncbi:flagellar basal-body MS-ring/collar protein FliF [Pseudomonas lijiangensis]|uniref:Flagellar M-ring protein n=1 Tax=Pseudomonas lijiangensis TaxID=2995658 RepID=A0ABX8HRH8_9PSED|nr:flagellar basal-body MS-ring/collar protein FliF [Pseudomonas lijiangensis]MBX8501116.1 flagellar M-ring protein FliF [Pseudomonas lijiangensis]MBX8505950.1 flagellar M-ring protein FliF [Pseudomonas lijiangensis]QWU83181.1 flagellar M-ring protein FliF [Pseudomonas lijiangensis]